MLDISILAVSDRNKPLLADFIPLITRSMEDRPKNERLNKFAVHALSQLIFEKTAAPYFEECSELILSCLGKIIPRVSKTDKETYKLASVLRSTLETGDYGKPPEKTEVVEKPKGHVMISYQWDFQHVAKLLQEKIAAHGLKTWFDLNDMGPNINDSMVEAVEGAQTVVVLFCRRYKESGNCRKECEMADNLSKNICFVKVQPDYQPEGWLNLVMGKSLWLPCYSENMIDEAVGEILKRVNRS